MASGTWNVSDAGDKEGKPRENSNEGRERGEVGGTLSVLCMKTSMGRSYQTINNWIVAKLKVGRPRLVLEIV